ncbi:MAG: hypothetical protein A2X12_10530 [Bacteroidetes bacterium GWE2_29_8]|nr:MAG: hypothetical protein A2X12_10530 [Bacteroidetes bacterium GWE2_29_8]OFY23219.1 MAG: hypothetical protein A2X02_09435 [Bacteroidetes bacterium GWF2_29_10]
MMEKYDIVIVGAGLGGLLCGNILSREGLKVCLLEKNKMIGGCIQSFAKNKTIFNTGLNYTEGLGEGEVLNRYFKYFNIIDKLKLKRLDIEGFERISFSEDNNEYPFAQGYNNFIESLAEYFPKEKENLKIYIKDMKHVCNSFPFYTLNDSMDLSAIGLNKLQTNAYNYLSSITSNNKLNNILGGMNSLYAGVQAETPLYIHSLINYTFIKSAWRIIDGGSQLAARIADEIYKNGGIIRLSKKVVSFGGDKKVDYVDTEDGERIYAKKIISNIHPKVTLDIVDRNINKMAFKSRISSLENTIGMFSLYIVLKKKQFPYLNYNHHHFSKVNTWTTNYNEAYWPEHYMLYTPSNSNSDIWANGIIAITYMKYNEVKKWEDTYTENRSDEYLEFKQRKAEKLIDFIEVKFPRLREKIECYYTSTPLTYRDYTATPNGSAYGILKKQDNLLSTIITPRSRIENLYFTGQNLNMHGILGVSIGAALTCSEIIGRDYLFNKIKKA